MSKELLENCHKLTGGIWYAAVFKASSVLSKDVGLPRPLNVSIGSINNQSEVTLGRGYNPHAIILDGTPPILDVTPPCFLGGNGYAPNEENDASFLDFWDKATVLGSKSYCQ